MGRKEQRQAHFAAQVAARRQEGLTRQRFLAGRLQELSQTMPSPSDVDAHFGHMQTVFDVTRQAATVSSESAWVTAMQRQGIPAELIWKVWEEYDAGRIQSEPE